MDMSKVEPFGNTCKTYTKPKRKILKINFSVWKN